MHPMNHGRGDLALRAAADRLRVMAVGAALRLAVVLASLTPPATAGDRSLVDTSRSPHAAMWMVDLDDALLTWRHKHVVTVERIIGRRRGTGGTEGVTYLTETLQRRCFPELWSLRTKL